MIHEFNILFFEHTQILLYIILWVDTFINLNNSTNRKILTEYLITKRDTLLMVGKTTSIFF